MWLLHAGHDRARLSTAAGKQEPDRRGNPLRHLREPLPLHGLPEHRQGHSIRRRQAQRRAHVRRPQNERHDADQRATRGTPAGHGLQAQARRGCPLRPRQGQLRRRPEAAGHALRRLRPLAAWPRPHQDDRHRQGQGGPGRARGADRGRPQAAQSPLHADARRRRPGGAGRGKGAVPESGSRFRDRRGPLYGGRRAPISSRSNTRRCR